VNVKLDPAAHHKEKLIVPSHSISSLSIAGSIQPDEKSSMEKDVVEQVYEHLLKALREQGLPVAQRLNVASIAHDLGVSRTPVTMALVRLECEGLVQRQKDVGWVTVPLGLRDIHELFDVRAVLDALLARDAAENVTPEASEALMCAVEAMEKATDAHDLAGWREADHRFHGQLNQLVRNQRVLHFERQIDHQLSRVQVLDMVLSDRLRVLAQEHRAIAEAVVAGDAERAVASYLKHTSTLRSSVVDMMNNVIGPLLGRFVETHG
jgi:DNA-binding GntR family transcriptional regulator